MMNRIRCRSVLETVVFIMTGVLHHDRRPGSGFGEFFSMMVLRLPFYPSVSYMLVHQVANHS